MPFWYTWANLALPGKQVNSVSSLFAKLLVFVQSTDKSLGMEMIIARTILVVNSSLVLFCWVCSIVYVHFGVSVYTCVQVGICVMGVCRDQTLVLLSYLDHSLPYFFETRPLWTWSLSIWLSCWLANELQGSPCLYLQYWDYRCMPPSATDFYMSALIQTHVLMVKGVGIG